MKKALGIIASLLFVITFFALPGAYVLLLFLVVLIVMSLLPSNKRRALHYQRLLPTSKIRSLAMGLVEIEGTVVLLQPLLTPIEKKECIGYRYVTERIGRDKDGKDTYTTIKDETFCNDFQLQDDTGKIKVQGAQLEFLMLEPDERYSAGDKRYTQYVLFPDQRMLLLGGATSGENREPQIAWEPIKKVFAIVPSDRVATYNALRPLRSSAVGFLCLFGFLVALILLLDIRLEDNTLLVEWPMQVPAKGNSGSALFN